MEENKMMQMNFEGGDKDKKKEDGDLSEDYDYGNELQEQESQNFK